MRCSPGRLLLALLAAAAFGVPTAAAQPETPPGEVEAVTTTGRVVDVAGQPLAGATVTIENTTTSVTTDLAGRFSITATVGAILVIEAPGFELALSTVSGPQLDEVILLPAGTGGETIELSGEAPAAAPGAAKIDRTELQRIPGAGGDVVKALTVMPGVVNLQIPLGYSGVVIRGSSPQDSRVLIDDFEVPVLFHNIGFRAVVPAEAIGSLEFIPGGFDVAYGRASSGIVSLSTRAGSDDRTTQTEVSMIDGGLLAQGPIGDRTRYMIGVRRSTIDFVLPSVIPESVDLSLTTVPSYWDGQLRVDHELSRKWKLSLSSVGTDDTFELYATKDEEAATKRFYNHTRFLRLTAAAKYYDGPWSANLALSGLLQEFVFEAGLHQKIRSSLPQVTPRVEVTRTAPKVAGLTDVVWRLGGEAQVGRASAELALPQEQREGEPPPPFDPRDVSTTFKGNVWVPDFAGWSALSASLDPRVRLTTGVRVEVFGRPGEVAVQPRGELQIKLTKPLTARFSAGAFRRPPEYQTEVLEKDLQSERSTQAIAGLQYEPREGVRIQTSAYYIDRSRLITRDADGALGNDGHGTTTGAELLATYRGGPWFTWLSYSYSRSTRIDRPGAMERLFDFDQPHSMNAAVSWKRGSWQLGGRFQLYSGLPYTPVMGSVFESDRNLYVPLYGAVNSGRAPIHHQLDLRVDKTWEIGPIDLTGFVDVQNVYMNESVVTYFYSYDYSQRVAFKSLPIIPSLGLRGVW
ncbi:MAG TPA: TonB-dependent receptor [Kofleriaceae bacterium]|nr:TonB-dependent receptor [Kofleriaceae bacterium]